jgi:hypothetical protein
LDLARSRSAKKFLYALGAAACLIAASCSTSPDGQASFALSNPGLTPEADSANDGAVTETATTVDGNLPDQVAYLPGSKPASSFPEAGVAAAAEASGAAATAETKPDTADLSQTVATAAAPEAEKQPRAKEQILTAGPDTRTVQVLTAADPAALAPAPKKRGFLSSLFSSNQDRRKSKRSRPLHWSSWRLSNPPTSPNSPAPSPGPGAAMRFPAFAKAPSSKSSAVPASMMTATSTCMRRTSFRQCASPRRQAWPVSRPTACCGRRTASMSAA